MRVRPGCLAAALCLLFVPPAAHAQEIASTLDQLRVLVRPGDNLTVTDTSGEEIRGKLLELSQSSVVVQAKGQRRELSGGDIQRITQPSHADLAAGARWGLGMGAGLGLLALASGLGDCSPGCAPFLVTSTVALGGIGAGVGVGIAGSIVRQRLIFNRAGTPLRLTVSPLLDREQQGVRVSLRF